MDDMRQASSHITHLIVCIGKSLQQRREWFPNTFTHHIHAMYILLDIPAQVTTPCGSLQMHPLTRYVLGTWQVSCGILHCDSSWVLLALGQPCRSELLRSPGPGTSQGWPLMVSVIPLTVHWCHTLNTCVCRRWVSPLGLLPHMISPNVSSCPSCTPDGTLFTDCQPIILLLWQKYHIFPSVIPIPSSPYWQRSLK